MSTMQWAHTRTGKPRTQKAPLGVLLAEAFFIRARFPGHPITIDGQAI